MTRDTSALTNRPSAFRRVAGTVGSVLGGLVRPLLKDRLSTFLLRRVVGLTIVFFSLLGETMPSSPGSEDPALDADARFRAEGDRQRDAARPGFARGDPEHADGRTLWAAYPSSDAQLNSLIRTLNDNGAVVDIDQQAGKPVQAILVQFLIPILLLVCLFALFTRLGADGGAGGIASFSNFKGKGRKRGAKVANRADVRRRRRRRRGRRRAARDPRLPRRPGQVPGPRRGAAQGRAARRSSRHRQDAAGPRHRG